MHALAWSRWNGGIARNKDGSYSYVIRDFESGVSYHEDIFPFREIDPETKEVLGDTCPCCNKKYKIAYNNQ